MNAEELLTSISLRSKTLGSQSSTVWSIKNKDLYFHPYKIALIQNESQQFVINAELWVLQDFSGKIICNYD